MNSFLRFASATNWPHFSLIGVAFLVGAALGMTYVDVGSISLRGLMRDSSAAEWFTVLGTATVGFGAWKYARVTHEFNVARERRIARSIYSSMMRKAAAATIVGSNFAEYKADVRVDKTLGDVCSIIEVDIASMRMHAFTDTDKAYLDAEAVEEAARLEFMSTFLLKALEGLHKAISKKPRSTALDQDWIEVVDAGYTTAAHVVRHAENLRLMIRTLRESERLLGTDTDQ